MSELKFKSVIDKPTYLKPEELQDMPLVGKYLSSYPSEGNYGPQINHKFETKDGIVILNGTKKLNEQMERVEENATVEVVYQGKKKGKSKDGKAFSTHIFDVRVAE